MSGRLVVGLGNPLAGDDGFGPAVLGQLGEEGGLGEGVELVPACTDLLGLIDGLARHDTVVLVDAVAGTQGAPGTVTVFEESTLLSRPARSTSAHRLSPVEALRVFRSLHPEAATRFVLVALLVDGIGLDRRHLVPAAVRTGARLVRAALPPS